MTDCTSCLERRPAGLSSGKTLSALPAALCRGRSGRRLSGRNRRRTSLRICSEYKGHDRYPSGRDSREDPLVPCHRSTFLHLVVAGDNATSATTAGELVTEPEAFVTLTV